MLTVYNLFIYYKSDFKVRGQHDRDKEKFMVRCFNCTGI